MVLVLIYLYTDEYKCVALVVFFVTCLVCGLSVIKDTVACYIKLCRGERTKFDTFVDPNVRGAQRRGDLLKYE